MSARHVLNIANDVIDDSQFMHFFFRRSLTRYVLLLLPELNFDGALQSVLAEAWELLLVFDHR